MIQNQIDLINHPNTGKGSTGAGVREAQQVLSAQKEHLCLTNNLMLEVASKQNLKQAFKAVKRNKGAAGVDLVSIQEFAKHLDTHIKSIQQQLLSHEYHPDDAGNDGLFVSNRKINKNKVNLPDVFASKIKSLDIDYSPKLELDGKNVLF